MKISLNLTNVRAWIIYIHKKNHLLLDAENLYGGYSKYHMTKNNKLSHEEQSIAENLANNNRTSTDDKPGYTSTSSHKTINAYALQLEKFEQLNTEDAPCDESGMDIDLEGCLQQYVENKLSCSIPWGPRNFSNFGTCESEEQLMEYYRLVVQTRYLGEKGIFEETGCKSSCHVNVYNLDRRWHFVDESVKDQVIWEYTVWILTILREKIVVSFTCRSNSISITMVGNTRR